MYDKEIFKEKFLQTATYKKLEQEYDIIVFDKHFPNYFQNLSYETPRQRYGSGRTTFSAVPFYYLEYLREKNPSTIFDLGCGWNIFKKYIPNIIGIDLYCEKNFFADIQDYVDNDFIKGHQNYFESVFSICALHFIPLSDIRERVDDFYSMIAPGGRGWLSLNAERMIERDIKFQNSTTDELENFITLELRNLPGKILLLDIDLSCQDNFMDGNIQIIFEKL